jgi:hypothetical protein
MLPRVVKYDTPSQSAISVNALLNLDTATNTRAAGIYNVSDAGVDAPHTDYEIVGLDGKPLMVGKETGILKTNGGLPMYDPQTGSLVYLTKETGEITDTAKRSMNLWDNSFKLQKLVKNDKNEDFVSFTPSDNVLILTIKHPIGGVLDVYAVERQISNGYSDFDLHNPFSKKYKDYYHIAYYDMQGLEIPKEWWEQGKDKKSQWKTYVIMGLTTVIATGIGGMIWGPGGAVIATVTNAMFIAAAAIHTLFTRTPNVSHGKTESYGTYGKLQEEMELWIRTDWYVLSIASGQVFSEIGNKLYVDPVTLQIVDGFGLGVVDCRSGYPIILHESRLVTIPNMKPCSIEMNPSTGKNELINAVSEKYFMEFDYHVYHQQLLWNGKYYSILAGYNAQTGKYVNIATGEADENMVQDVNAVDAASNDNNNKSGLDKFWDGVKHFFGKIGKTLGGAFNSVAGFIYAIIVLLFIALGITLIVAPLIKAFRRH